MFNLRNWKLMLGGAVDRRQMWRTFQEFKFQAWTFLKWVQASVERARLQAAFQLSPAAPSRPRRGAYSNIPAMIEMLEPRRVMSAASIAVTNCFNMGTGVELSGSVTGLNDYANITVRDSQTNQVVGSGSVYMGSFNAYASLTNGNHILTITASETSSETGNSVSASTTLSTADWMKSA